jgi:sigma-B regulation protein RsbU (phosphoserine phosphatase)
MNQHRLYRTLLSLGNLKYRNDEQLLGQALESIIQNNEIPIKGGRIWKLDPGTGIYRLLKQYGEIDLIDRDFRIRVEDYPPFLHLHKRGTILATETNKYLRQKGIRLYSATGIGEKVQWKNFHLYQYVLGINADYLKHEMMYALNIIGNALTTALKNRKIETKVKLLEADLDKARDIQKSILPEHELRFWNYDLYGVSLPDRVVGGDFFDYLHATDDKERLGVVIGDAASKGLSAAAQALYVSGALRMGVEFQTKISSLIGRVNQLVNKTFTPEHFISMVYLELVTSDRGLVVYVNAGHNNPILLRNGTDEVEMLQSTGQLIGPFPNEKYHSEFIIMNKGDVLLLYTDGVVEAPNEKEELFGEQRLMHLLRTHRHRSPKEICQLLLEQIQIYSKAAAYSDDKTLVVIKRTK